MKTTLNKIRSFFPCKNGWEKLLNSLNKTKADDQELHLLTILDSNEIDDALWCLRAVEGYDKEKRLFAVKCARFVQHLMKDPRSIDAINVAEKYANGQASEEELKIAREKADEATYAAALTGADAAQEIAYDAAYAAAVHAAVAYSAKYAAAAYSTRKEAYEAARKQQEKDLREMLENCK